MRGVIAQSSTVDSSARMRAVRGKGLDLRVVPGTHAAWRLVLLLTVVNTGLIAAHDATSAPLERQAVRWPMHSGISSAREHARNIHMLTGYAADPGECGDVLLGPLPEGEYDGEEAWRALIAPVCTLVERADESTGATVVFADMSNCTCRFNFPPLTRLQTAEVFVTASALPMSSGFDERASPLTHRLDRKRIGEIGATSVPELLRHVSQATFQRGSGYRASGAQFAELRGLGAPYTLVLINGRRTFGAAAELASSAFDLSAIPISAVERVEIWMDANSITQGTDAVGGIVNVVLRDRVEPEVAMGYGSFHGGGARQHASISGGLRGERTRFSVFLDAERQDELLGHERGRWNDQDYRRYGGYDYRSRLGTPPNIASLDGQNLPGLTAPFAAAELDTDTGLFEFLAGRENRTSLRAYQAIVPRGERVSFVATAATHLGASRLSTEVLAVKRESEVQFQPSSVSGFTMSATHPENPHGVPVRVDALLAGLPAQRFQVMAASMRAVAALDGRWHRWTYSAFLLSANEEARARLRNVTNPAAIAQALTADEPSEALSLYSTSRAVAIPAHLLVDGPIEHYVAHASQAQASLHGPILQLPAGALSCNAGVDYRRELMGFNLQLKGARRDVASSFAVCSVPLIDSRTPAIAALELRLGARADHYSDIGRVTTQQFGLVWQMTDSIRWHISGGESFRPPSLAELYWGRVRVPTVIRDARRQEVALIPITAGGNPQLRPTWGQSSRVGVIVERAASWQLSADFWRIETRGHVATLSPASLLASEDFALPGRVVRGPPTLEDDRAGRPGALLELDVSRANVGGARTRGVDLSAQAAFATAVGTFEPRFSASITDAFLYSDTPSRDLRMQNRVGVASESGTIPRLRGIASLGYRRNEWSASIHARVITSYRDRDSATGEPIQRRVPGGAQWDFTVSRALGRHLRFTFGALNVTNKEPPFAHVGGSLGFDPSQGDLAGRKLYGGLSATLE